MPKEKKSTKIVDIKEQDVEENKTVAALSYAWILCLVPLLGKRNSKFAQFHAKQGLVLFPNGFATTAYAYNYFLEKSGLKQEIRDILKTLDTKNVTNLMKHGDLVRKAIIRAEFPEDLAEEIRISYKKLSDKYGVKNVDVAVRSSATAEDLPDASFAGQQESF